MSTELVVKDNCLIEARTSLTQVQQKIILKAISRIDPLNPGDTIFSFSIAEFASQVDLKNKKTVYNQMKIICQALKTSPNNNFFIEKENGGFLAMSWISSVEYKPREAVVEIEFSKKLMPYLVELKERFTTYYLANVMPLKSGYSIRIFELLKQYEKIKKRKIKLEDLRQLVGTTIINEDGEITKEDYPLYGHFKSRVILPAQKELKQKTDIYFNFKEITKGRKVVELEFEIFENKKNKKKIQNAIDFDQMSIDILQLQEEFKQKTNVDIKYETLNRLVKDKGFEIVKKYIDNWDKFKHQSINNVLGFFIVAVTQEFDIPTKQSANNQNFNQREYTEEELKNLYANYINE